MSGINEIRDKFLTWFAGKNHEIVASDSLVPANDPSLMFTSAGMVQFKNLFTEIEKRNYSRAVTAQKCVRAGGKHNDLDNVGYTERHHTFFEMLGNFSFGDYFKDVAIDLAWQLITKEFGLDAKRLYITVYHNDDEAFNIWKKITGFNDAKIIRINSKDNFWEMGDVGPCGPCSEIFFDHGEKLQGGLPGTPEQDGARFVEIWNLVFMQYEKLANGKQINLPKPSIDTGLGLERMAALLAGSHDNYESDIFKNLISASENLFAVGSKGEAKFSPTEISHRVIADHIRAICFLIADGVLPANEGRGYVLRRIMRRAMRHANLLGATEPLLWKLTEVLIKEMGAAYGELATQQNLIEATLKMEESRFQKTLARGLDLLENASSDLQGGEKLDGKIAFKLYDTYGFPLDLTQDVLRKRKIEVDVSAFDSAMAKQKLAAKDSWVGADKGGQSASWQKLWFELSEKISPTEFLGYRAQQTQGIILALVDKQGKKIDSVTNGEEFFAITNQTVFYAESGGQQGDSGTFTNEKTEIKIIDTQKQGGGLFVHEGKLTKGKVQVGDAFTLAIDSARREKLCANHSATHLLHEALREILGNHISQKGSLVAAERLRFDFSHNEAVTESQREKIFSLINFYVRQNTNVETIQMAIDDAKKLGAKAQFGEKYGDEVRVVSMGKKADEEKTWSIELCGGTHVNRTGDIGLVVFAAESAVGAGLRRIEALTGEAAQIYLLEQASQLKQAADLLKAVPSDLTSRLSTLLTERKQLEKTLADAQKKLALGGAGDAKNSDVEKINGINVVAKIVENILPKNLKNLCDEILANQDSAIVIVGTKFEGKAAIVVGVSKNLTTKYDAVALVRAGAETLGGKGGGGRADMAQAGGADGAKLDEAIKKIKAII